MAQAASNVDMEKAQKTAEQVFGLLGGALVSAMIYLGDRLGFYRTMQSGEPMTSDELARKMGLHERWVREWLRGQAAAGLIDYKGDRRFALSSEAAFVLADENSPLFLAGGFCALPAQMAVLERLPESFRTGLGLPYDALGLEHDLLVTSGGVSVGPHDLVRGVAGELGVEEIFWGVAMKPGKPVSFGVRDRTLVFGLPGNPVSALVGFELLVRPAVLALQGAVDPRPRFAAGVLAHAVRRNAHRDELVRARSRLDRDAVVLEPLPGQDSHMIARAAAADALVLVPRGEGELAAGAVARYLALA